MPDYETMLLSNDYADYIVPYSVPEQELLEDYASYGAQILNNTYALLHAPRDPVLFSSFRMSGYSSIPKLFTLQDTLSLEESGIIRVQNQPVLGLTGRDILIGLIDTGIDYLHPAFKSGDGRSRILYLWDQTVQTGTRPAGFYYGSEYTALQIDEAIQAASPYEIVPSRDENGHGTFLAGVAAGSSDEAADFTGAAPGASLVVVKLKEAKPYLRDFFYAAENTPVYQESDLMMGVRYLALTARRLQKSLIICVGMGTNQGGHIGYTPLDAMLSSLTTSFNNVCAVVAGGNEGGAFHHYYGTISERDAYEDVEILVRPDTAGFTTELWAQTPDYYSVALLSPLGEMVSRIPLRLGREEDISFVFERTRIQIYNELIQTTSGNQLIFFRFDLPTAGIWKIRVYCTECTKNGFHLWLPVSGLANPDVTFISPDPNTTLVVPASAFSVLTVSTYSAYDSSLYLYSSRGFTPDARIKPDFAAPGVSVSGPRAGGGYTTRSGSSVAAAMTAGSAALILQWGISRPLPRYFNSAELRSLFIRGARRIPTRDYPNREWGYGSLDVYQILTSITPD